LDAIDIHRSFQTPETTLHVLNGISFSMPPGEMVAVTGASGVGKSTLLHLLGGLDRPTSGEVRVNGTTLGKQTEQDLAAFRNRNVGFVFQFHYLLEDFSALENVMIPMLVAGRTRREAAERAELMLELVGLTDRKSHRPTQLSGGEQQRVAVARALANDPRIVLADEPSGDLDIDTGRRLHDLLFRLNQEHGTAFLIATHNRELSAQCSRRFEIVDGKIREWN
jgi:lipoprotein-releasing system ATP-binding protein